MLAAFCSARRYALVPGTSWHRVHSWVVLPFCTVPDATHGFTAPHSLRRAWR